MLKTSKVFLGGLLLIASTTSMAGAIYNEVGDAGQTLATAQLVNTLPGGTALDAIRGTLESPGADLYRIFLTGGKTFSATTTASSLTYNNFDMQLFLFNSSGIGVYANDDDSNSPPQSTLPASATLTPSVSGIYYLGISGAGYLPVSAGGSIFATSGGFLNPTSGVVGPTGPGGTSALTGFTSTSGQAGLYEIQLTGAQFLPSGSSPVPEPGTLILIGAGLVGIGWSRRKGASKQ